MLEAEEVSEAAMKKLCGLCLHVDVSDDLPTEAATRERTAFVNRCTERLGRAAVVLRPIEGCCQGESGDCANDTKEVVLL